MLDGYLARRFQLESRLGEQLDSLGDAVFCFVMIYLLLTYTDVMQGSWTIIAIFIVLIIRMMNLAITKLKFKTWGILHTYGNKTAGILLYLYVPIIVITHTIALIPGILLFLLACVSSIEEMVILLIDRQYDANRKSLFLKNEEL